MPELAQRLTVFNYARRGRGASGDTPPYSIEADWPATWLDYRRRLEALLAEDRRGDAVELFLRMTEAPEEAIAGARSADFWPVLEAMANTLAYDAACIGDGAPPTARLDTIEQATLVATGGPHPPDAARWVTALAAAADAIAASLPHGKRRTFEGQGHVADPKAIAPLLADFFA